jgi:hypothetical protein
MNLPAAEQPGTDQGGAALQPQPEYSAQVDDPDRGRPAVAVVAQPYVVGVMAVGEYFTARPQ